MRNDRNMESVRGLISKCQMKSSLLFAELLGPRRRSLRRVALESNKARAGIRLRSFDQRFAPTGAIDRHCLIGAPLGLLDLVQVCYRCIFQSFPCFCHGKTALLLQSHPFR